MFVVALCALGTSVDVEASLLAGDLGVTPFEARLVLNAGFPSVVLKTADRARAVEVLSRLRTRGHVAIACDASTVVASGTMTSMRDFKLDGDRLVALNLDGATIDELPYDDILCILKAMQRKVETTTIAKTETKFSAGRALVTGGMMVTKSKTAEVTSTSEQREQVLFLFRRSGAPAWILRESASHYGGLGTERQSTTVQNFAATTRILRAKAPRAHYDERLMTMKVRDAADPSAGLDLLAHLTALSFTKV